jgi:uncharacterized protein (DUF362 family)
MSEFFSRRNFFQVAGAGLLLPGHLLKGQQPPAAVVPQPVIDAGRSKVGLVHGEDRRKNVHDALVAIDEQIRPKLKRKKSVVIKPNNVSTENQLAATHADALRGILDYLAPRFKGPVVIAESSAGNTLDGFENFKYTALVSEYRSQKVSLVDLNKEARFGLTHVLDADLHLVPVRLAACLLDPDAFVISSAMLKTHNTVVVTLAIKNMVLGAPLHSAPGETPKWNDKRKYHFGVRQTHLSMFTTAQKMLPNWGVAVIDGFEGMEGNGPGSGTPVASRIAVASTDFVAADRVGLETMGVNPDWVGYLNFCGQVGLGQYDLSKVDVIGAAISEVKKPYRLHQDMERELKWMGPMDEIPPKLGRLDKGLVAPYV